MPSNGPDSVIRHPLVVTAIAVAVVVGAFVGGYAMGYTEADNSPDAIDYEEARELADGDPGPATVHFENGTSKTFESAKRAECVAYRHDLLEYEPVGCGCAEVNGSV